MITISLCMIVRDEEAVLARALDSVREAVDEIIIVDTGSTDRTREIAGEYTERVYDFPWKQDFAAARNFACGKATMDYWMWMDADDVMAPDHRRLLKELKKTLDPSTDVVMMRYLTGFDSGGNVTFSYYRERLLRRESGFFWEGRVHEAVTPRGKIVYSAIALEHRKPGPGDPDRNLAIYEAMLQEGETLEPRHQFYYGRELYYHGRHKDAAGVLTQFLESPGGWEENKIEACVQLAFCEEKLGRDKERLLALLGSFYWAPPRAEVCCEIGRFWMERESWRQAAYWYRQATEDGTAEESGAFFQPDCRGYLPAIQLCVCYDRLGDRASAYAWHKKSSEYKPDAEAVKKNQEYFDRVYSRKPPSSA